MTELLLVFNNLRSMSYFCVDASTHKYSIPQSEFVVNNVPI